MINKQYCLTSLSPIHVGSGTLFTQFDGVYQDKRWYLIDLDRVLERNVDFNRLSREMSDRNFAWVTWLRQNSINPSDVEAYSCPCPEDPNNTPVREAIKNVYGKPYLPGTSVKGAIRTSLLNHFIRNENYIQPDKLEDLLFDDRNHLQGKRIEKLIFGKDPYNDLMRALHISDTDPATIDDLEVGLAWTYTIRKESLVEKSEPNVGDYNTYLEWIRPNATMKLDIGIDEYLFSKQALNELRFNSEKEQALRQLSMICNNHSHDLIRREIEFYGKYNLPTISDFYKDLETTLKELEEDAFLLNIGWGGGWEMKTTGDFVRSTLGMEIFNEIRSDFGLGKNPKTDKVELNYPFPKSRKIGYEGGAPMWALGWLKVELINH